MSVPDDVVNLLLARAKEQCECVRKYCSHRSKGRCTEKLVFGKWHVYYLDPGGGPIPWNCEIVCSTCHLFRVSQGGG